MNEKTTKKLISKSKACYTISTLSMLAALILEILPFSTAMVFATSPTERIAYTFSYFDVIHIGYGDFSPMVTGVLSAAATLLMVISLFRFDRAKKSRKAAFVCSLLAVIPSIAPLFMFGSLGMTAISYIVSAAIVCSVCFQAVANRSTQCTEAALR